MNRKSAALLIGLLIITVAGTVALTMAKSVIAGTGTASRLSDSIIAEEASQAGVEYALYQCKIAPIFTSGFTPIPMPSPEFDLETDTPHRHVNVADSEYQDTITRDPNPIIPGDTTGYNRVCNISSIGQYVKTYKKHTLNINFDFNQ